MILRHSKTTIGVLNEILEVEQSLFCLKNTFSGLMSFCRTLVAEITEDFRWFDQRPIEMQQLTHALRSILRFITKNFTFLNSDRVEVIFIKKALVFCNLNKLKSEYSELQNKIKDVIVGTELGYRFESMSMGLFKVKKVLKWYFLDFVQVVRDAKHTFEHLQVHYPKDVMKISKECENQLNIEPNTRYANYSIFDRNMFQQGSLIFASFLLALDPQTKEKRFLSKIDLNGVDFEVREIGGVFGNIQNIALPYRNNEKDDIEQNEILSQVITLQAIKPNVLLRISPIGKLKFISELSLVLNFKHHGLINILGYTLNRNWLCIAMEPIEKTLREYIDGSERSEKVRIGKRESLTLLQPVVEALDYLHSFGITHNNIRPENIFLCNINNHLSTKLTNLDYGLSTEELAWKTLQRDTFVWYRAPELLYFQQPTTATDVYSLAITLWELLQSNEGIKPYDHLIKENMLPRAYLIEQVLKGQRPPLISPQQDEWFIPDWAKELLVSSWSSVSWERPTTASWITYIENLQESNFFESAKKVRPPSIETTKKVGFSFATLKKRFKEFRRKRRKLPGVSQKSGSGVPQVPVYNGHLEGSPSREMSKTLMRITTKPNGP